MAERKYTENAVSSISDSGLVKSFFCDELLASVLHSVLSMFPMDQGESKGSVGRGLYHERAKGSTCSCLKYTT